MLYKSWKIQDLCIENMIDINVECRMSVKWVSKDVRVLKYFYLLVMYCDVKWNVTFQINVYICITLNWSDRPEDIDTMKEDTQRSESFQNKREDKYVLFVATLTWSAWPVDIYIKKEWKEIAVVFRYKKMIISWWPRIMDHIILLTKWKYISAQ